MRPDDWFLTAAERGNAATDIDRRRRDGLGWTSGNDVTVHVDGASYFARLDDELRRLRSGAQVWFTGWQGHADQRLAGPGTEIGARFSKLAYLGVEVRGLLWRSHPRQANFSEEDNMQLASDTNEHGAVLALDGRVRRGGSHHQKFVVIGHGPADPAKRLAFAGGIDLCHGRRDDSIHGGDKQATDELDPRYGPRPPWHDVQLELRGPAVEDLAWSFRERWNDPEPLDHRNPLRRVQRSVIGQPEALEPLAEPPDPGPGSGTHLVQVLRTYPARRPRYGFAPKGERSIARAHLKALRRARRLVVIEDQYLWAQDSANAIAEALRTHHQLQVVIVVPRYPDQDGRITGAATRFARRNVIETLTQAGGDRVAFYDLVNEAGTPIYVHSKICLIDDVWLEVGSDNLNRRSWTHDSEIACGVIDEELDQRHPTDPGGLGDGARVLARTTRMQLWHEHLGRSHGSNDGDLVDPGNAFELLRVSAQRLADWDKGPRTEPRPPGHLLPHRTPAIPAWIRPLAAIAYRTTLDPDGRPARLRRRAEH